MNSFKLLISFIFYFAIFGCRQNISMPQFIKGPNILHIDSRGTVGGLRSLGVSAEYTDMSDENKRSLYLDWDSDTWENTGNKPILLISVGDKVYEVPAKDYEYKNGDAGSSIKISCKVSYMPNDNIVRFYLCDSSCYDRKTKSINLKDNNRYELFPLNNGRNNSFNFIFTSVTTIDNLKAKRPIAFYPLGTVLLFDNKINNDKEKDITIQSDCFDVESHIDLKTGMGKANARNMKKTYKLRNNSSPKPIYGIYSIATTDEPGTIRISGLLTHDRTYHVTDFKNYSGKIVNLSTSPIIENEWFVTQWQGDSINVYDINGENISVYYREYGENVWRKYHYDSSGTSFCIKGLDNTKTYELRLFGMDRIQFTDHSNIENRNDNLRKVTQWGATKWATMQRTFFGCRNLDITATDVPDLTKCNSLKSTFYFCQNLIYNNTINNWDVSNIKDMSNMFTKAEKFNQNINDWIVSNVEDMSFMFCYASVFNQPLNNWDVSQVRNMNTMFYSAKMFNQNISNWDVRNVTEWDKIFYGSKIKKSYKPAKFR